VSPLDNAQRSQGGKKRLKSQTPEERTFQAMIAASRRPLLRDADLTPEEILKDFKKLEADRHWNRVVIVAANRDQIRRTLPNRTTLPDDTVLRQLKQAGGAIGFLGVTLFGKSLQVYYKPLKQGIKVIEDLDRVKREVMADVLDEMGKVIL
jgi:hypothetical protein